MVSEHRRGRWFLIASAALIHLAVTAASGRSAGRGGGSVGEPVRRGAERQGADGRVRSLLQTADLSRGLDFPRVAAQLSLPSFREVEYVKLLPVDGAADLLVALATWRIVPGRSNARELRLDDRLPTLTPTWRAISDAQSRGCFLVCFKWDGNSTGFCPGPNPVIDVGAATRSASCTPGDLEIAKHGSFQSGKTIMYFSGSFSSGMISVEVLGQEISFEALDVIGPPEQNSKSPHSHIANISPSSMGVWAGGYVTGDAKFMKSSRGQFQMSASSGKERGFVAHLSPYRSGGFGVTWLQQLGDERVRREGEGSNELVDRSPKITNIFNTKECMAVVADAWAASAPLFHDPELSTIPVLGLKAPSSSSMFTQAEVYTMAISVRLDGGSCTEANPPGASVSVSAWPVGEFQEVDSLVARFVNQTTARVFVAVNGQGRRDAQMLQGFLTEDPVWGQYTGATDTKASFGFGLVNVRSVNAMRLMDDGDTLYMYLQRSRFPFVYASTDARELQNPVCSLGILSLSAQQATYMDIQNSACRCIPGDMRVEFMVTDFMGNAMSTPTTRLSFTGSFFSSSVSTCEEAGGNNGFGIRFTQKELEESSESVASVLVKLRELHLEVSQPGHFEATASSSITDTLDTVLRLLQSQPSSTPVLKAALDVVHVTIHAVHSIPGYALEYSALQTMVVVLSEGLHYLATSRFLQQYSLEALDKLPLLAFRTMSEGQVLTFFTDSIGLALGWSTPASPIRDLRAPMSVAALQLPEEVLLREGHFLLVRHMVSDPSVIQKRAESNGFQTGLVTREGDSPLSFSVTMEVYDPVDLQPRTLADLKEPVKFAALKVPRITGAQNQMTSAMKCVWYDQEQGPGVVVAHNHLRPGELARLVSVHVQRGSSLRAVGVCECIQSRALPLHFNNAVMMRLSLTGLWFASIPFCGVFAILTQGLYTDFVKDGDKEKSCVLLPLRPPQGMTTSWNSQYRMAATSSRRVPIWNLNSDSGELGCRTAPIADGSPASLLDRRLIGFDGVTFEGECFWYQQIAPRSTPSSGSSKACLWDDLLQSFVGLDCAPFISGNEVNAYCACNHFPRTARASLVAFPGQINTQTAEDKTSEVKAKPSPPDFQLLAWFLVSFIVVGILVLLSFFWHRRKKLGLVCKFLSSDYGYQGKPDSTERSMSSRVQNSLLEMWSWTLETGSFKAIWDEIEILGASAGADKKQGNIDPVLANMWSAMGLPLGRALCCIPTAESLSSWIPVHEVQVDIDTWREQALGTSMVMAHFVNHEAVARDALEQQLRQQETYFAGCHPMGFRALVRRWRCMLCRKNMIGQGNWYSSACVWRLVWLQRHDGLWDLTSDLVKALGAEADPPAKNEIMNKHVTPGTIMVQSRIPDKLQELMSSDKVLMLRVWCSCLAMAYFDSEPAIFSDYSGREAKLTGPPVLTTVIAKDAIFTHVRGHMLARGTPVSTLQRALLAIEEEAHQAVRSFQNLRTTRLKAWIAAAYLDIQATRLTNGVTTSQLQQKLSHDGSLSKQAKFLVVRSLRKIAWDVKLNHATNNLSKLRTNSALMTMKTVAKVLSRVYHYAIKSHPVWRILYPSALDDYLPMHRILVFTTTLLVMLAVNAGIYGNRFMKCCKDQREALGCHEETPSSDKNCTRYEEFVYRSPSGILYEQTIKQTVHSDASNCFWLETDFVPRGFTCVQFPDTASVWDMVICGLIASICSIPVRMVLYQLFTFRTRYIYGRLWFSYTVWNKVLVHWGWNLREKMEEQTWATLLPVEDPSAAPLTFADRLTKDHGQGLYSPQSFPRQAMQQPEGRRPSNLMSSEDGFEFSASRRSPSFPGTPGSSGILQLRRQGPAGHATDAASHSSAGPWSTSSSEGASRLTAASHSPKDLPTIVEMPIRRPFRDSTWENNLHNPHTAGVGRSSTPLLGRSNSGRMRFIDVVTEVAVGGSSDAEPSSTSTGSHEIATNAANPHDGLGGWLPTQNALSESGRHGSSSTAAVGAVRVRGARQGERWLSR